MLEDIIFKATYGFFGSVLSSYPTEMKEFDPSEKVDLGELVILGFLIFFFSFNKRGFGIGSLEQDAIFPLM